jgi:hypothetical protein
MDPMSASSEEDIPVASQGIVPRNAVGIGGSCYTGMSTLVTKSPHCVVEAFMFLPKIVVP